MKMLLVDDLSIIGITERKFGKLFPDLVFLFRKSENPYLCGHNKYNQGHAGLPAVQKLTKHNSFGSQFQIRCFFHNTGAFSSKL